MTLVEREHNGFCRKIYKYYILLIEKIGKGREKLRVFSPKTTPWMKGFSTNNIAMYY